MFLIHGNHTTYDSFVYLLLIFAFNLLSVFIHEQPGVRRSWGEGRGRVILELTVRAEVNFIILLIHYLNNA